MGSRVTEWNGIRRDAPYVAGETALLLVDLQRIWVEPGLDAHRPAGSDAYFQAQLDNVVIPNAKRLLDAARAARIEVIHTIIRSLTADGRDRSLDHKLSGIHVPPDAPEGDIIEPLRPRAGEIVLPKTSSGVFNSTNLDYLLGNLGVRLLIVAGLVTDQCVDMAVRDGADRGYLVTCVSDACASYSRVRHEAALAAFGGYCWTGDTATVTSRLRLLAPPEIE
jgi:nicotinamidase-related amidase